MSTKEYPSIEYVRQCFQYDDGRLFWLERPRCHFRTEHGWKSSNVRDSGNEAGTASMIRGRIQWMVGMNCSMFYRSIVVWAMHHGEWPKSPFMIDHKDRNPLNDRIDNLRVATRSQNQWNSVIASSNTSGYKGVWWDASKKKWVAAIRVNGKRIYLGCFQDPSEACAAYVKAAIEYHGEFACDGKNSLVIAKGP